jgi:hypothetical protein
LRRGTDEQFQRHSLRMLELEHEFLRRELRRQALDWRAVVDEATRLGNALRGLIVQMEARLDEYSVKATVASRSRRRPPWPRRWPPSWRADRGLPAAGSGGSSVRPVTCRAARPTIGPTAASTGRDARLPGRSPQRPERPLPCRHAAPGGGEGPTGEDRAEVPRCSDAITHGRALRPFGAGGPIPDGFHWDVTRGRAFRGATVGTGVERACSRQTGGSSGGHPSGCHGICTAGDGHGRLRCAGR